VSNWRTRFKTRDGEIRHVLLTLSRLKDRKGHVIGTLGISKDITVEMDLQKKLIQSEQAAALGRAVTAIQHAIKNMLNTLKGGLYIVQVGRKKQRDEQVVEGCEMIDDGIERIRDLSMQMLKYAREWKVERESVDVAKMLDNITIAAGADRETGEKKVDVYTNYEAGIKEIMCDPRLIHMGLMDIVSNAVDACELREYPADERPEISIRLYRSPDGEAVVIDIRDNGIGMEPEVVANVFTPFFSTKKKTGTGLGLALTKRIIDLHNGEIVVESEPEKGALFRITLPIDGKKG
jgi:signal transduction histidine kinase